MFQLIMADDSTKRQIFSQVHTMWPHADDHDVHVIKRLHAVSQNRAEWFALKNGESIVASCGAYPLTLFTPLGQRLARGFGAVFTPENARGKGYATHLLNLVMTHYESSGVTSFILFSDINPVFYARLGFISIPSFEWNFTISEQKLNYDWDIQPSKINPEDPGSLGFTSGLQRSKEDNIWILARIEANLRKIVAQKGHEQYWFLSAIKDRKYTLLESTLPLSPKTFAMFKRIISADAHTMECRSAYGWWSGLPADFSSIVDVTPRTQEILMWRPKDGDEHADPLSAEIKRGNFRILLSEHF